MVNLNIISLVATGGALGAVSRYLFSISATRFLGINFPFGTLLVNIFGSFLMGAFIAYITKTLPTSLEFRAFFAIGFLGSFTTFSAFSLEIVNMIERGQFFNASFYATTSLIGSVLALFGGLLLIRNIF